VKYLLTLFLFIASLSAGYKRYLLPDDYEQIIYLLRQKIEKSDLHVTIFSRRIAHYDIEKALLRLARTTPVTLYLNTPQKRLALYKNIDIRLIRRPIATTIVQFDDTTACFFATPLEKKAMRDTIALFVCNDTDALAPLRPILRSSKEYLQEVK